MFRNHRNRQKKELLLFALLYQLEAFVMNQNHITLGLLKAEAKMTISLFQKKPQTYQESIM